MILTLYKPVKEDNLHSITVSIFANNSFLRRTIRFLRVLVYTFRNSIALNYIYNHVNNISIWVILQDNKKFFMTKLWQAIIPFSFIQFTWSTYIYIYHELYIKIKLTVHARKFCLLFFKKCGKVNQRHSSQYLGCLLLVSLNFAV